MKKIKFLLLTLCFLFSQTSFATEAPRDVQKETYLFAVRGADTLRLDRYYVQSLDKEEKVPCIIFAFGGGFVEGTRDAKKYAYYFDQLAKKGYTVVSIDYRLGLKNVDGTQIKSPTDIIPLLKRTINHTVEDLYSATNFILENADEWQINKEQIIASGSSAGAITVLQAEYEICNQTDLSKQAPQNFNYAGIVSFAGAILSLEGDLQWKNKPCPIQLFHGDADGRVPYDKLEFFTVGFYGSKHIAEQLVEMKTPYYFYNVMNHTHSIAESPMTDNIAEIESFIQNYVIKKQPLLIESKIEKLGLTPKKKNHTIMDFIINNF